MPTSFVLRVKRETHLRYQGSRGAAGQGDWAPFSELHDTVEAA